jgi:2-oxoisovalerate dehydrogenase E1 component
MTAFYPSAMQYDRASLSDEQLLDLYEHLLRPRMIEEKMLKLLRQGKVSKWFSGIGQEAISVGITRALLPDEIIFTLHRNLGVFTSREMPLDRLFGQWQGTLTGYTKGRDRSFHFGSMEHHIVGMISHLGPQLSLGAGVALANRLAGDKRISVAFSGEGGTSEGEFHEALNTAAVWQLPVIFVIENNGYGLSTPTHEQYRCNNIAEKGPGYGMRSLIIDGNNILEIFNTIRRLAAEMREKPEPILLECMTFRMRGHEEASGTKYVPKELFEIWEKKDPLQNYINYLTEIGLLTEALQKKYQQRIKKEIETALEVAFSQPEAHSTEEQELADVYAPFVPVPAPPAAEAGQREMRYIDAISDGLKIAMQRHEKLVLMGQDIAAYGGAFKITEGFLDAFGADRVRNTPLCESAIVGVGLGLSLRGWKSMVEMQFADFVSCGFNQIVNNLAKLHYRWGQNADVVIRMPSGGGVGAGPFHSQSNEAWFFHTPGLKVVFPSNPVDAKGLLLAAFDDPNPVMFFEHKALYRQISAEVPEGYYTTPIGKALLVSEGKDLSIITYGMGVHWAKRLCESKGIDADILDLRTLLPLDYAAIDQTVKKTNRVLVLHEDTLTGGIGGEIAAYISEHLFQYLDAPVLRVGGLDTPIPFSPTIEREVFMPVNRFTKAVEKLLQY